MLDDLIGLLGNSMDLAAKFSEFEHKSAPIMAEIKNNSEGADPELLKEYDKQVHQMEKGRAEFEGLKEKLRNMKV